MILSACGLRDEVMTRELLESLANLLLGKMLVVPHQNIPQARSILAASVVGSRQKQDRSEQFQPARPLNLWLVAPQRNDFFQFALRGGVQAPAAHLLGP